MVHGLRPDSKGPPAVSLGMNIDQVIALLGKPKVSRKGSEIYADLAQQGKLSEEDVRKEYLIFQHPAGRYDLVVYERKIIQIRVAAAAEVGGVVGSLSLMRGGFFPRFLRAVAELLSALTPGPSPKGRGELC